MNTCENYKFEFNFPKEEEVYQPTYRCESPPRISEPCFFNESIRFDEETNSFPFVDYEKHDFAYNFSVSEANENSMAKFSPKLSSVSLDTTTITGSKSGCKRRTSNLSLNSVSDNACCDELDSMTQRNSDLETPIPAECLNGDLNLFVEKLLNANPVEELRDQGVQIDDKTVELLTVNKRRRKTKAQIEILEKEYALNQDWDKAFMKVIGKRLGMSESSVYKWHWDQKHKGNKAKKAAF